MSKSIPSRARSPVVEGATVKLRGVSSVEAALGNGLREIWEKSDLPAGKFADEAASFWRLPRLGLQELMNVIGAVEYFSPRFLRESSVFPFRAGDDGFGLAVAGPVDGAAIRAAEIVCGRPVTIAVASFDDIATVLELRLEDARTG